VYISNTFFYLIKFLQLSYVEQIKSYILGGHFEGFVPGGRPNLVQTIDSQKVPTL